MTATVDLSSKKLPARLVLPSCPWIYGGTECGHTPSGPTDYCGKTWTDCADRSNTARFGGMPEVKKPEDLYIR
jgi:phage-related protein